MSIMEKTNLYFLAREGRLTDVNPFSNIEGYTWSVNKTRLTNGNGVYCLGGLSSEEEKEFDNSVIRHLAGMKYYLVPDDEIDESVRFIDVVYSIDKIDKKHIGTFRYMSENNKCCVYYRVYRDEKTKLYASISDIVETSVLTENVYAPDFDTWMKHRLQWGWSSGAAWKKIDSDTLHKEDKEGFEIFHTPYVILSKGQEPGDLSVVIIFAARDSYKTFVRDKSGKPLVGIALDKSVERIIVEILSNGLSEPMEIAGSIDRVLPPDSWFK